MASMVQKFKDMLTPGSSPKNLVGILDPELGFKISINESTKELKVTVIGARHLPTLYGLTRPEGYLVKVKLFPGKEKFETKLQVESWPVFNQEFVFEIITNSTRIDQQLNGKFVVLTVYAILENSKASEECKQKPTRLSMSSFRNFLEKPGSSLRRSDTERRCEKAFLYKRRTVGAVTYNLESKNFTQRLRNNCFGTPDIWRPVKSISSGLVEPSKNVENSKGSLELTMSYSVSEDGKNDMITLTLSRIRFSIQTMETHENYTGNLYVKMKIFECNVPVSKWKSDKFEPTISLKLDPNTATLQGTVRNANLYAVQCEVRLMCRNKLGKKTELGKLTIGPKDGHWSQAVDSPGSPVTLWHNFK